MAKLGMLAAMWSPDLLRHRFEEARMRAVLIAMIAAAAIGFAGATNAGAAPAAGAAIYGAANVGSPIEPAHCRWYPHGQ